MKWYSLKYTDDMPEGIGGYAKAWFIRIRPKYKDDRGIHSHEETHVFQWWVTLGFHSLLYLFSKRYRLWAEVEAYRVQLQNPPADQKEEYRRLYADYISSDYGLSVTPDEAYKLLGG
jgi:hypothetical protein